MYTTPFCYKSLSLTLSFTPTANPTMHSQPRLNWSVAFKDGSIEAYAACIDAIIWPRLGKTYDSISSLDEEVHLVSASVFQAALTTIATDEPKRSKGVFQRSERRPISLMEWK